MAARAADMARKGYLRVAGVIENMSDFACEHGTSYALFGRGRRRAAGRPRSACPLVGRSPAPGPRPPAGDAGTPVALDDGELGRSSPSWRGIVAEEVAPVIETSGCTARMLDRVEAAVVRRRLDTAASHGPAGRGPHQDGLDVARSRAAAAPSALSLRRWAHSE